MVDRRKISVNNTKLQWQHLYKSDSYITVLRFRRIIILLIKLSIAQNREHTNVEQYNDMINTLIALIIICILR